MLLEVGVDLVHGTPESAEDGCAGILGIVGVDEQKSPVPGLRQHAAAAALGQADERLHERRGLHFAVQEQARADGGAAVVAQPHPVLVHVAFQHLEGHVMRAGLILDGDGRVREVVEAVVRGVAAHDDGHGGDAFAASQDPAVALAVGRALDDAPLALVVSLQVAALVVRGDGALEHVRGLKLRVRRDDFRVDALRCHEALLHAHVPRQRPHGAFTGDSDLATHDEPTSEAI